MKKFNWERKYLNWGIMAFLVFAACILFYMALRYIPDIFGSLQKLMSILSPFIWGLVITYLMLPLTRILHRNVFTPLLNKLPERMKRRFGHNFSLGLAVVCSIIAFLAVVVSLIYLIIPQLYTSIKTIVDNSQTYLTTTTNWLQNILHDYPEIEEMVIPKLSDITRNLFGWIQTTVLPGLGSLATSVTFGVISVVKAVYNVVIGVIVAVYVLYSYDRMSANMKRIMFALFSVRTVDKILYTVKFINETFMNFISGKLLDSVIIAIICYICCAIMNIPYTLLVSVIVGVTNVIPFFGPFIGAIPSIFFILMVNPIKALVFAVFIVILQQVDGNIIGPKILGSTTGINGFWIMFAIIVGAGLFGFWGMLLGVPVFVVIYTGINTAIDKKLKNNGLPVETAEYLNLERINPDTLEFEKKDIQQLLPRPQNDNSTKFWEGCKTVLRSVGKILAQLGRIICKYAKLFAEWVKKTAAKTKVKAAETADKVKDKKKT